MEKNNEYRLNIMGRKTIGQTKPCIDCGDINWSLDNNRGEVFCDSCGAVVETNVIDEGPEWTNHSDGQDKSRVGAPSTYLLADKGFSLKALTVTSTESPILTFIVLVDAEYCKPSWTL